MSELLVNTIKKADGTGSLSVPAESGTVVTTASPSLGRKNLILNGSMAVAQRGTSSTTTTLNSYATVDRFRTLISTAFGELALTQEQSTDAPSGFGNSYKLTVSTPETALAANELLRFEQRIEGQDLQRLKKGTSDAEAVTLSFWVKCSVTGTYTVNIFDKDNTRVIAKSYTIDSANTWEYKTITFAGDTTGALDNNNAESLTIAWNLAAGTDRTSGTLATSWEATTNANLAVGQTDIVTTSGATWQITGVQLEVGSVATPFEHRSYGEELALCQRYYWRFTGSSGNGYAGIGSGGFINATLFNAFVPYPVEMRASPTFSIGTSLFVVTSGFPSISSINANFGNQHSGRVQFTTTSSTAGFGGSAHTSDASTSFFDADAEL